MKNLTKCYFLNYLRKKEKNLFFFKNYFLGIQKSCEGEGEGVKIEESYWWKIPIKGKRKSQDI